MDPQEQITYRVASSSLGEVLLARSERGICAILISDTSESLRDELRSRFAGASFEEGGDALAALVARVVHWIGNPRAPLELPLDIRGTDFQKRVWAALQEIPVGSTASYAEIARKLDAPDAARAVAGACAVNALALAIPCHRVVHGDGGLAGYRWGVERKRKLLEAEGAR